jgi:PhnB protein
MSVKPVPDGYHTVTPYLTVANSAELIEFLQKAFNATLRYQMKDDSGIVRHAEMQIGDSLVMIGQARDQWVPKPANLYLYVPDCDATYKSAIAAGGKSVLEPATQFYGDRHGGVDDSQGNTWWIATHVEDVSPEEIGRRAQAAAH